MATPKDVLVLTTSSVQDLKIQRYLKPISAHIVAGTNLFSDFFGGLTDVFGGRSNSYQKQLASLYNEAIERIKLAAYEIGANCVVGLNVDMDEISGKGKSMFMLTAIGTAVIIEKEVAGTNLLPMPPGKFENVGVDTLNILRTKKDILGKANTGTLVLQEDTWNFITLNQVDEVFPYLLKKYSDEFLNGYPEKTENFHRLLSSYIAGLPEHKKIELLYTSIQNETNEKVILRLPEIIKELYLFDFSACSALIRSDNFLQKKIGLRIASFDKLFYNKQDILELENLKSLIIETFLERGIRLMKKQLLSSKEKEVWNCECGKTNDIEDYCANCSKDIYGFKSEEMKPTTVEKFIQQKIELIKESIE